MALLLMKGLSDTLRHFYSYKFGVKDWQVHLSKNKDLHKCFAFSVLTLQTLISVSIFVRQGPFPQRGTIFSLMLLY